MVVVWDEVPIDSQWPRPPDPPPWFDDVMSPIDPREHVISIIGIRDVTGRIDIRSVTRTVASPELRGAVPTDAVVELLGEDDEVLAAGAVQRLPSHGDCACRGAGDYDAGPYAFQAMLPDPGRGRVLRMWENNEELWRYDAPEAPPAPASVEVDVRERLHIRWWVEKGDDEREVWVRWRVAADKGAEPQTLLIATGGGDREVPLETLPPGRVLIDAVVHDGFDTAVSDAVDVEIPSVGPSVTILHPYEHRIFEVGQTMRLQGIVTAQGSRKAEPRRARWRIDGVEVATELDAFVTAPESGSHEVTLRVTTDEGGAEASVTITTLSGEEDREGQR